MRTDVHQHLWPPALVEALRRRARAPRLDGWTLHLSGEAPYDVRPADHAVAERAALAGADGIDRVLVSLSSPLGIEHLPPDEAVPLLAAWHDGVAQLPSPFGGWAAAGVVELAPELLADALDGGCVGLQLPATSLADPAALDRLGPLLELLERHDRPLLVHPGPATVATPVPSWWPPVVSYVSQQHAAWHAWHVAGRANHPTLRVCFVALAGLGPLHHERLTQRGGSFTRVDPEVFLETSSYGVRAVDAVIRVVGVDALVHGSDRPYAEPGALTFGDAFTHAVRTANPSRLLSPHRVGPVAPPSMAIDTVSNGSVSNGTVSTVSPPTGSTGARSTKPVSTKPVSTKPVSTKPV